MKHIHTFSTLLLSALAILSAHAQPVLQQADVFQPSTYGYKVSDADTVPANFMSLPTAVTGPNKLWDYSQVTTIRSFQFKYVVGSSTNFPATTHKIAAGPTFSYLALSTSSLEELGDSIGKAYTTPYKKLSLPLQLGQSFTDTAKDKNWGHIGLYQRNVDVLAHGSVKTKDSTYANCLLVREYNFEDAIDWDNHDTLFTFYCKGVGAPVVLHQRYRHEPIFGTTPSNYFETFALLDATTTQFAVGIEPYNVSTHLSIYPNPIHKGNNLNVQFEQSFTGHIELISLNGTKAFTQFVYRTKDHTISTQAINPGIYFLVLENAEGRETQRIVIQ